MKKTKPQNKTILYDYTHAPTHAHPPMRTNTRTHPCAQTHTIDIIYDYIIYKTYYKICSFIGTNSGLRIALVGEAHGHTRAFPIMLNALLFKEIFYCRHSMQYMTWSTNFFMLLPYAMRAHNVSNSFTVSEYRPIYSMPKLILSNF